ncbi:MAG: radical SAM protein [Acidobacteriota bacterium]|nr:radical SAM protein [Acidobacteriota bacterium]
MQPSIFNVRVPLPERDEVFLMNTFSDAQILVSPDVVELLDSLPARRGADAFTAEEQSTLAELAEHGFLAEDRETERRRLNEYFHEVREGTEQLRVTVMTTLQCNFACDYCFQGDHGDHNKHAEKMSLETARQLGDWIEGRLDTLGSSRMSMTFFGGEPLLNMPVVYYLAERVWRATQARGVELFIGIITNGLLLTPEIVDRLVPYGLGSVKITLDGDRAMHDKMRPLRGGQGTFDRIVNNLKRIAGKVPIAIGGNFDMESAETYPALLDFLKEQSFADSIAKITFKPIIRTKAEPEKPKGFLPLMAVDASGKPIGGSTCMTSAGGGGSACDTCNFVDEKMSFLREETKQRGFPTIDGVHMGPCEIHRRHAYTVGPEGSLYACPGFTGELGQAVGHIHGLREARHVATADRFDHLAAWKNCGDCSFIPVCAGGCSVSSHAELGDMNTPACHKSSFESAMVSLAHEAASVA